MYGNRGVLHNENLALVRRYQVRRWLACVLEFRGRRRPIMRPRRYTELFFLDEAVALAAGHRLARMPARRLSVVPYGLDGGPRPSRETCGGRHRPGAALAASPCRRGPRHLPGLLSELPDGVFIVHDTSSGWQMTAAEPLDPAGYTDRIDQFDGPAAC